MDFQQNLVPVFDIVLNCPVEVKSDVNSAMTLDFLYEMVCFHCKVLLEVHSIGVKYKKFFQAGLWHVYTKIHWRGLRLDFTSNKANLSFKKLGQLSILKLMKIVLLKVLSENCIFRRITHCMAFSLSFSLFWGEAEKKICLSSKDFHWWFRDFMLVWNDTSLLVIECLDYV